MSKPSDLDFLIIAPEASAYAVAAASQASGISFETLPKISTVKITLTEHLTGTKIHATVCTGTKTGRSGHICYDRERLFDALLGRWYLLRHCYQEIGR